MSHDQIAYLAVIRVGFFEGTQLLNFLYILGKMLYDKLAEVFRKKKEAKAVATEKDGSEK